MTERSARLASLVALGLSAALLLAAVVLAIVDPHSGVPRIRARPVRRSTTRWRAGACHSPFSRPSSSPSLAGTGAIVAARRPRNPIGWLLGVARAGPGCPDAQRCSLLARRVRRPRPPRRGGGRALGRELGLDSCPGSRCSACVPLLFPTGRPAGPRWRFVGWVAVTTGIVTLVATAFSPGPLQNTEWVTNPLGLGGLGLRTIAEASFIIWLASALAAVVSLVVRFRRSRGIERQQLKWVTAAGCLLVVSFPVSGLLDDVVSEVAGWACLLFALLGLAVALSVALLRLPPLRHRRRDQPHAGLRRADGDARGAYLGSVLLLQLAAERRHGDSGLAVAGSTLAVAALFRPARARIQALVDRRFYRRKYDAARTLERFGARLRDEVDLDALERRAARGRGRDHAARARVAVAAAARR